jgi:hypothetical protein
MRITGLGDLTWRSFATPPPKVDPDAELHTPFRFEFDVVRFHGFLDFDLGLDRLDRTRERTDAILLAAAPSQGQTARSRSWSGSKSLTI